MKKLTALMLALVLALFPAVPARAAGDAVSVVVLKLGCPQMAVDTAVQPVDPQNSAVTPIAEDGRTLVPVSRIVSAFGGESGWEAATNAVWFSYGGERVSHVIGTDTIQTPAGTVTMNVPSKALNDRTYVPVRYVLEGLGLWVGYEPENQLVVVSTANLDGWDLTRLAGSAALLGQLGMPVIPDWVVPLWEYWSDFELEAYDGPYIPDPVAFFGFTWDDMATRRVEDKGYSAEAEVNLMAGDDHIHFDEFTEYIDLLEKYNPELELVDHWISDSSRYGEFTRGYFGDYREAFFYRFVGERADRVQELTAWDEEEFQYHFCIRYDNGLTLKDTKLSFTWGKGVRMEDTGARLSRNMTQTWNWVSPSRVLEAYPGGEWYTQPVHLMFTAENEPRLVYEDQVQERLDDYWDPWFEAPVVRVYDLSGKNEVISILDAPAYQDQGWYDAPVSKIYSLDGKSAVVYTDKVDNWLDKGWCRYESQTKETLYALDGREVEVYKAQVDDYLAVGWYTYADYKALTAPPPSEENSSSSEGSGWSGSSSSIWNSGTTTVRIRCAVCGGSGEKSCTSCSGRGYFERRKSTPNYSGKGATWYTIKEDCGACRGTGKRPCTSCGGDGYIGN